MGNYRVILPIEIDGKRLEHGDVVALNSETAAEYSFALIAVEGD